MCWVIKNKTKSSYGDYADDFMLSWGQMTGATDTYTVLRNVGVGKRKGETASQS